MAKARRKTRKPNEARSSARAGPPPAELRVRRTRMAVNRLTASTDDVQFWRSQSAAARLAHMEYLRLINYGEAALAGRLKRVFEIAQLRPG
jgi:hypothetical protein